MLRGLDGVYKSPFCGGVAWALAWVSCVVEIEGMGLVVCNAVPAVERDATFDVALVGFLVLLFCCSWVFRVLVLWRGP